ncbi:tryptophan 2,3-dioxygenase family protein [Embleya sp. NPDC005971]|uniref:tryptophan 2,3-dioxygenase family protein n=1 Tax=unclassified Embleya TaxID=2699296 RepID=UPI0033D93906
MADLSYTSYLQTETLLALQKTQIPETADRTVVLAEHFFIVAHQSCELWLKQTIADLNLVTELLSTSPYRSTPAHRSANGYRPASPYPGGNGIEVSVELLQRASELLRVLHEQVIVLERLQLRHFVEFRPYLGTASGAQSDQFRVLGRLIGDNKRDGELYEAFVQSAAHHGHSVAEICRLGPDIGGLHRVAEALLDVGNGYWRWKVAHLGLMSRMVGGQEGTGGTTGEEFLMRRITLPFPELRRLRGSLHAAELTSSPA